MGKVIGGGLQEDGVLEEIVRQARLTTMAIGAFVASVGAVNIAPLATSGSTSGEFVTYLNRDRRFVDSCLESAELQRCVDSETSVLLDASACLFLGARSIVIIPIVDEAGEKLGVFGIFSPQPDAFSSTHLLALQTMSQRIPAGMKQRGQYGLPSDSAPSLLPSKLRPSKPGKKLASRKALAHPSSPAGRSLLWLAWIIAIILLGGWIFSRATGQHTTHASAQASAPVNVSATPVPSSQPSQNPIVSSKSSSATSSLAKSMTGTDATLPSVTVKPPPAAAPDTKPRPGSTTARSGKNIPDLEIENALDDAPGVKQKPATMIPPVAKRMTPAPPPREAIHFTRAPEPARTDAPAPNLPNVNATSGPPPAGPPIRVLENTALERLVQRLNPEYPEEAMADHVKGPVVLDVIVGKDGSVQGVSPVSGDARLTAAAGKAVIKWEFAPLLNNGHFVSFETQITVPFALP
ncbi:MAG TPA: TonB family protein [Candidatus Sulfotelmatobacter sp.]